jgi:hypothetical protein
MAVYLGQGVGFLMHTGSPLRMKLIFRISSAHAGDIVAVAAYLKMQVGVPVWLIGTSTGTFSAAAGAIAAKGIDGLVLTSTITRPRAEWRIATSHSLGPFHANAAQFSATPP